MAPRFPEVPPDGGNDFDRSCRINKIFIGILELEERILRQEERIDLLEQQGMHSAAVCAREILMIMSGRLVTLCESHKLLVTTARLLEEDRRLGRRRS